MGIIDLVVPDKQFQEYGYNKFIKTDAYLSSTLLPKSDGASYY